MASVVLGGRGFLDYTIKGKICNLGLKTQVGFVIM